MSAAASGTEAVLAMWSLAPPGKSTATPSPERVTGTSTSIKVEGFGAGSFGEVFRRVRLFRQAAKVCI